MLQNHTVYALLFPHSFLSASFSLEVMTEIQESCATKKVPLKAFDKN